MPMGCIQLNACRCADDNKDKNKKDKNKKDKDKEKENKGKDMKVRGEKDHDKNDKEMQDKDRPRTTYLREQDERAHHRQQLPQRRHDHLAACVRACVCVYACACAPAFVLQG